MLCAAVMMGLFAASALAGPLNPPAGPVASTAKPLAEVEPRIAINSTNARGDANSLYKITQPGSYYLTGNITGVAGRHGIEIAASGVTLDLNGFDLVGVPEMGAFDGVSATLANLTDITVRNGSLRGWGGDGVDLATATTFNTVAIDLQASGNAGNGISVNRNATLTRCAAYNNEGHGITAVNAATITECKAYGNDGAGITAGNGSTIIGCAAYSNGSFGISTSHGSVITHCSAYSNTTDGIRVLGQTVVTGNACANNGNGGDGAGILVLSSDNRIEGNNCTGADRGIDVDFAGNIIIRNTCSGNTTNWTIVAGNAYGPIVVTPAGAAVEGNTAAAALGSTDPNANFTY
jgi:parallel beta-helix repeat protein